MSDPTNEDKLIQIGEKYRAERTVFVKFVNAVLKVKQKYPSFEPAWAKVREGAFDGEELEFTFTGKRFSLTFNFSFWTGGGREQNYSHG